MSHKNNSELLDRVNSAQEHVAVGSLYYHYKNPTQPYSVLAIALQEDTGEPCVVYQALHDKSITWVRNLSDWTTIVEDEGGNNVPRFSLYTPSKD
jgi:hypothetical protein